MTATPTASQTANRWRFSSGFAANVGVGLGLLLLGMFARSPVVATMGVPLLLTAVWGWLRVPTEPAVLTVSDVGLREDTETIGATVTLEPSPGMASIRFRAEVPGHLPLNVVLASSRRRIVELSSSGVRTGRQESFAVAHQWESTDRLARSDVRHIGPVEAMVLPAARGLELLPLPFRLQGMTGAHNSPRLGEGWELHDVSLFRPGDVLGRIDWKVTARRAGAGGAGVSQLYVRRTHATADATVVMLIDSRDDFGPDVYTWSGDEPTHPDDPTSLDIARSAVVSIAKGYLDQGDRVGLVDLGRPWRQMRPAGGRRHFYRLVHQVAGATPMGEPTRIVKVPQLPSAALVYLLSAFLDDQPVNVAALLRRAGHRVVAVDVLPPMLLDRLPPRRLLIHRLVEMERQDRLQRLHDVGVEVLVWGAPTTDEGEGVQALGALARRRRRRR